MADISVLGVVGTDGVVPVYQPEARGCWWWLPDLWQGPSTIGKNRYVPKVLDYVMDPQTYTVYRVEEIDPVTLIPRLHEVRPANMAFVLSEADVLFGLAPNSNSDTYRVYLDRSVMPYVMAIDIRFLIPGTSSSYVRIFRGPDLAGTGKVVSRMYDNSGNFVSDRVPLELATIDSHTNYSIRVASTCHSVEDMPDGELVTVVVYSDAGSVTYKRQMLIENTAFIRNLNISRRYITSINLECPFLSPTYDHQIDYPLNVPIQAINLIGVVNYSDGSHLRLPVNGTKFKIFGLDQYVSTIIGQKIDLVLSYALSPDEAAIGATTGDGKYLTEPYSLITVNPNNSYTVKLFGYPVWKGAGLGYTIQWYLLNLDRNVFFDVTPYVEFTENTGPYDPKAYGVLQRKAVSINLRDVSGAFRPFIHTQLVDIILKYPATDTRAPWEISLESSTTHVNYGSGLYALYNVQTPNIIRINCGIVDYGEWLTRLYNASYPLTDRVQELVPPRPTHFELIYGSESVRVPVGSWNQEFTFGGPVTLYDNVYVKFLKQDVFDDLVLSIVALTISA